MKFITTLILLIISSATSFNILGIYPYNGKSHFIVYRVLLRELAKRGHNVTVISYFPEERPLNNYHDISLADSVPEIGDGAIPIRNRYWTAITDGIYIANSAKENCEVLLANKQVQDLVKLKPKFDVILLEQFNSDCALGVAYKLGAPVVATTSNVMMPFHFERFGIPNNPSFSLFQLLDGGTKPNLRQRLERVILNIYFKAIYYWTLQSDQKTLATYFDDIPPLEDLAKEIKFLLVYHNFMLTGSQILPANVIEVGGYHVTEPQPLTGDLKKFVEEAEHGIIYISFGSIAKSSSLPPENVAAILDAISELPQRFIWKWEDKSLEFDKNKLYVDSWLPQGDILGNPKTLAFLSHAGMGGTTEAMYSGVPIVAMPIDGDQPCNAAAIEESGLGIQLDLADLNKDNLVAAFKKVLDAKFQTKAKEVSSAWRDRPLSALNTAVFWTEFAARHPSLSFRTRAADVPFYQYYCLDLIAILLATTLITFGLVLSCCNMLFKREKSVQSKQNTKILKCD